VNRIIVVLEADLHAGHKLGLCDPETVLRDENNELYRPAQTKTQEYLWALRNEHIDQVADLADGCPVLICPLGDLTHGTKYPLHLCAQLVADQVMIAVNNEQVWYKHPRINLVGMRIVTGTEAHTLGGGSTEVLVTRQLQQLFPDVNTQVLYHLKLVLEKQNGESIDMAHHGPFPGSRNWLKGSTPAYYLRSAMMDELDDGYDPPRVYARAHYHTYCPATVHVQRGGKDYVSDLIILPSYTGIDDHGRRATRSQYKIDHGMVALEFENGLRATHPFWKELAVRTTEVFDG